MPNSIKLLLILLVAFFSATSQAQNYYVCDTGGDDKNDGKSEEKPFKTFEKGINAFNNMFAGSSLLFCRGGEFPVTKGMRIYNNRCGKSALCTISDYGDSTKAQPIISTEGQTALNFQDGGNADPDGGYLIKNLTLIANGNGDGVFIFNDVDDLTLDNLHIEGFRIGVHSAGSNALNPGTNGFNDRLVLSNSTIINNHAQGFLGSCQDCFIENNVFENNGYAKAVFNHNIYVARSGTPAKGITIRENVLYKSAIVDGKCSGVSLVAHGLLEDLVIENNTVKEDVGKVSGHCWGISVDPGYAKQEEAFYNVVIKNNKLINVGDVAIGCASCDGVSIVENEIIDEGDTLIHGIKVPVRQEDEVKSRNIVIKNNKVILNHLTGVGVSIGGEHEAIVSGNDIRLPAATRTDCFHKYGANSLINTGNNLCQTHNGVSFIDKNDEQTESNQEAVIDSPILNENFGSEKTEVAENVPVEMVELPEQQLETDYQNNEERQDISEPSSISQLPIANITDTDNSDSSADRQQSKPISTNASKSSFINEQSDENSTANSFISRNSNPSSGGASGGSSSSSKLKKSTAESDLTTTNATVSYSSLNLNANNATNVISIKTEQMSLPSGLSKTEPESSQYSVKVKDVIEASKQSNEGIDVTQCRAYAANKCLMK